MCGKSLCIDVVTDVLPSAMIRSSVVVAPSGALDRPFSIKYTWVAQTSGSIEKRLQQATREGRTQSSIHTTHDISWILQTCPVENKYAAAANPRKSPIDTAAVQASIPSTGANLIMFAASCLCEVDPTN